MHYGIVTNTKLYYWKVINSPLCTFCELESEDTLHLLYNCNVIKKLWKSVDDWLKTGNISINMSVENIILNNVDNNPFDVVNTIILIIKQYIYIILYSTKLQIFIFTC